MTAWRGSISAALIAVPLLILGTSEPANSVENQTISRFMRLSDQFHARLPNSPVAGLSTSVRRDRAVCILTRFEASFGAEGTQSLMQLMGVLSKGAEFDDATIVAFNNRFGPQYDQIVQRCTQASGT